MQCTGLVLAVALAGCASGARNATTLTSLDPVTHEVQCSYIARHRIGITVGGALATLGLAIGAAAAFDNANHPNANAPNASVSSAEAYLYVAAAAIAGLSSAGFAGQAWSSSSDCEELDHRMREFQLAASDCQAVLRIAAEISGIDTVFYGTSLADDPTIARCRAELPDVAAMPSAAERGAARAAAVLGHRAGQTTDQLTESARSAARRGDCATVVKLGDQVRAIDASVHDTVFVHDPVLEHCLAPVQPPTPPDPVQQPKP